MAYILNIETSTTNCSVAISYNGEQISLKEDNNKQYSHAERLHLYIDDVLKQAKINSKRLDAISVSRGPGSYTGLRIGISAAKGLCYALDIPLLSIPTLEVLARRIQIKDGYIIPILDARRMEVYSAVYDEKYFCIEPTCATVLDKLSFENLIKRKQVYFIGNATKKTESTLKQNNAKFINKLPSASQMCLISFEKFKLKQYEDVAYFEPFYLKDFISFSSK